MTYSLVCFVTFYQHSFLCFGGREQWKTSEGDKVGWLVPRGHFIHNHRFYNTMLCTFNSLPPHPEVFPGNVPAFWLARARDRDDEQHQDTPLLCPPARRLSIPRSWFTSPHFLPDLIIAPTQTWLVALSATGGHQSKLHKTQDHNIRLLTDPLSWRKLLEEQNFDRIGSK